MKKLNAEIIKILSERLGKSEGTIRKDISLLSKQYSSCTGNARAQIYAMEHGLSVLRKLDKDDRLSLPNIETKKQKIILTQKRPKKREKDKIIGFIKYETKDGFRKAHIEELNRAYTYHCYTSTFILCRKVIENLLIDIIMKKYPAKKKEDIELYFNTARGRTKDFSEILKNLEERAHDFGPDGRLLRRIINRAREFKDDANDKTHSWYHIVRSKKELHDTHVQDIINMISELEKNI
ncbi:MAG: hypothetical protein GY800_04795 [Planctomycetes bacterium]|nr:hypothetical protein [Planctomycetota bacterium]